LKQCNYKGANGGDVVLNLSAQLAAVPITSTKRLLSSISNLVDLGLNADLLSQTHHEKIFAQLMVECEENVVFKCLPGLANTRLHWSHIPSEVQSKIIGKLPMFGDLASAEDAASQLSAFRSLKFSVVGQSVETQNKIIDLAAGCIAHFNNQPIVDKPDARIRTPVSIIRNLIDIGFVKASLLSPSVVGGFQQYVLSKEVNEALAM
jgi:hypothetical protein